MSLIHYVLIARQNNKVLCDYTEESGNFPQIAIRILKHVKQNQKSSILFDEKYYNISYSF